MAYTGEIAALAAALFWAMAAVIYRRMGGTIPPLVLNGFKGTLAVALLALTIVLTATPLPRAGLHAWGTLLLSGAIGIGLGDTAFFAALNAMGERRTVLTVETLAPPLTVLLGALILREFLSLPACVGILITLAGVAWVLAEQKRGDARARPWRRGVLPGVVAALCQALGGVFSRSVVAGDGMHPLWSAAARLLGGLLFVAVVLGIRPHHIERAALARRRMLIPLVTATFFGTYLAIFLQQLSLKYTRAAITQTLISTSALFIIPFVALHGEKVSLRAVCGSLIALAGITVLFLCK